VRLDKFEKLWSSYQVGEHGQGPPYPTAGAGGVDVMSGDKGVTVWRPQPPMGYAIAGHIITAGVWQPDGTTAADPVLCLLGAQGVSMRREAASYRLCLGATQETPALNCPCKAARCCCHVRPG
jgi:hypothetical protein